MGLFSILKSRSVFPGLGVFVLFEFVWLRVVVNLLSESAIASKSSIAES